MQKLKDFSITSLFDNAAKIPYIIVFAICALLLPVGFGEKQYLSPFSLIYAGAICTAFSAFLVFRGNIGTDRKEKLLYFAHFLAVIWLSVFIICILNYPVPLIMWIPIVVADFFAIWLYSKGSLNTRNLIGLMIIAAIFLRFAYILYTSTTLRQHDMGTFASYTGGPSNTGGHTHYIMYWYLNGLKLPDFNVSQNWQFYQPPLHHWMMALLLKVLTLAGIQFEVACEAIQILPMLYSSLLMVVCYRIFRKVKLSGTPLVVAMAVICFHPAFVIMGGFYNNDLPSLLFALFAVDRLLVWYRNPVLKNIIPIAIFVGCSMMSKLSGWMVAPAIALVFIIVFIRNIRKSPKHIIQYFVFLIISVPMSLWWQIRNLIKFDMPLTWVPKLSESFNQYLGNIPVTQRLFDFGNGQLSYVYKAVTSLGAPYNEYNPTLGLLKTSIFGEGAYNSISSVSYPQISVIGPILFWVATALFAIMFISFIASLISRKTEMDIPTRLFFGLYAAVLLVSFYLFCFEFPFTCTQNIRYCSPIIPLCAMGLGLMLKNTKNRIFRYTVYSLSSAFIALTLMMFTLIGI